MTQNFTLALTPQRLIVRLTLWNTPIFRFQSAYVFVLRICS